MSLDSLNVEKLLLSYATLSVKVRCGSNDFNGGERLKF